MKRHQEDHQFKNLLNPYQWISGMVHFRLHRRTIYNVIALLTATILYLANTCTARGISMRVVYPSYFL